VRWIGITIVTLYVLSIPWYREPGGVPRVILGLPDWVAVALAAYVLIAGLTSLAWLRMRLEDEDRTREVSPSPRGRRPDPRPGGPP
jgi:hypothetical protein